MTSSPTDRDPAHSRGFQQRPIFVFSSPTTPNGDLHLGHLGGPYLGADAYTRFQRMNGNTVFHIAGSDDFQSYVAGAARRDGRGPAETAAHYSAEILATHRLMDIEIDEYTVSGVEPGYPDRVKEFFSRVAATELVGLAEDAALFDGDSGQYLYEVDVSGGCPTCGNPTGGNMCEECGEPNICADLLDPRAGTSTATPRLGRLNRYQLRLDQLATDIENHHRSGRVPARVKELAHRLFGRPELSLAITHPGEWGVAPDEPGADGQVIWVWVDMAYRFLHGIEVVGRRSGQDWHAMRPQADWKIVHFMGFDNTFYHCVFVPALYRLAHPDWNPDIDYNLNEFSLLDGSKFSTSRRHAVWGKDVLGPQTVDAIRCYLSWVRPEGRRTNFVMAEYEQFVSEVLIGGWQHWLNELGRRIARDYDGLAPEPLGLTPEHDALLARLSDRLAAVADSLAQDGFSLNRAARELDGIVTDVMEFRRLQEPVSGLPAWSDQARGSTAVELAAARLLAAVSTPVMPRFAARLAAALGSQPVTRWPGAIEFVPAGTAIELADAVFFGAGEAEPVSVLLPWLRSVVAESLQVSDEQIAAGHSLAELGMTSMQSIALQYQLVDRTGLDVSIEDLLGERSLAELARDLQAKLSEDRLAEFEDATSGEVAIR